MRFVINYNFKLINQLFFLLERGDFFINFSNLSFFGKNLTELNEIKLFGSIILIERYGIIGFFLFLVFLIYLSYKGLILSKDVDSLKIKFQIILSTLGLALFSLKVPIFISIYIYIGYFILNFKHKLIIQK